MSNTFYVVLFFAARYLLMFLMLWVPKFFKEPINPAEVKQSQKDRESMWPMGLILDTLALGAFLTYGDISLFMGGFWVSLLVMMVAHIVVVEPLYYGFHLLLHVDWFYRNHHIYHHRSVRTEATTSMSFTLLERISYTILFAIPPVIAYLLGLFNFWSILTFFYSSIFSTVLAISTSNWKVSGTKIPLSVGLFTAQNFMKGTIQNF